MKTQPKLLATLLVGTATALAACSGSGISDNRFPSVLVSPPTQPAAFSPDSFGAGFATKFNADNNSDPTSPVAGDIIAIDPTADPLNPPPDP